MPVSAYERCWFMGGDFGSQSFEQQFQSRLSSDYNSYCKAHFDTRGYFTNFLNDNPSIIGRYSNLLIQAVTARSDNKLLPFPRLVVFVPDDDIIKCFKGNCPTANLTKEFSQILNYIMTEHERAIAAFKDYLPAKCLKSDYPQILWIQPPSHDCFSNNADRFKFNQALDEVARIHNNVSTLPLKKVWDPKDTDLFISSTDRFTSTGLRTYWESVDCTVGYFHSIVLKKREQKNSVSNSQKSSKNLGHKDPSWDRFRWQNPRFNRNFDVRNFRRLPSPLPPCVSVDTMS